MPTTTERGGGVVVDDNNDDAGATSTPPSRPAPMIASATAARTATESSIRAPADRRPALSLIVPCPDGAFPYLTPTMLRRCFPFGRYPHLVLGISVRDACVVPAVAAAAPSSQPRQGDDMNGAAADADNKKKRRTTATNPRGAPKNQGYTFAGAGNSGGGATKVLVDPWLLPYRRVAVPTFDLWDDDDDNDNSASPAAAVSSNDNIWVRTPHGRLSLSAATYVDAARSAGCLGESELVAPLFDAIPPPPRRRTATAATPLGSSATSPTAATTESSISSSSRAFSSKRKLLAVQRCQTWYRQCVQHAQNEETATRGGGSTAVRVLSPVVLDPTHRPLVRADNGNADGSTGAGGDDDHGDDDDDDDEDDLLLRQLVNLRAEDRDEPEFRGNVLIGWHALDSVQRQDVVQRWRREHRRRRDRATQAGSPIPAGPAAVVVLKTRSLMQFLDAARLRETGSVVRSQVLVACDLPAVWSRSYKAFVLRLPSPPRPSQDNQKSAVAPEAASGEIPKPKRPKIDPNPDRDNDSNAQNSWLDENGCVRLSPCGGGSGDGDQVPSRHPWFRDASPIVRGCMCAACRNHTRAYIYHLVCAKELLGEVLLFVHNLHHLLALVDRINRGGSRGIGDWDAVTEDLAGQLPPPGATGK